MTRKVFHFGLIGLVVVTTLAAFSISRNVSSPSSARPCTSDWLCLSDSQCKQIQNRDPEFGIQAQALAEELEISQSNLIETIQDEQVSDDAIREQANQVVHCHHQLMRRVVQHLLVVREYADTQQCLQLNGLCQSALKGKGLGRGHGRQRQMQQGGGHGQQGLGRGQCGKQCRGCLTPVLDLSQEQQAALVRLDPDFEHEISSLTEAVCGLHNTFSLAIADVSRSDTEIEKALDALISAREQWEQRTIEHVLRLRPLLTPEQQQRLIGLSQHGCRWRGGRNQLR